VQEEKDKLSFQLQFEYETPEGAKQLRMFTKQQRVTKDPRETAKSNLKKGFFFPQELSQVILYLTIPDTDLTFVASHYIMNRAEMIQNEMPINQDFKDKLNEFEKLKARPLIEDNFSKKSSKIAKTSRGFRDFNET
jgi:hypothetical protein